MQYNVPSAVGSIFFENTEHVNGFQTSQVTQ